MSRVAAKLVSRILKDPNSLDTDPDNNRHILDALVRSRYEPVLALITQATQVPASGLVQCIQTIDIVIKNCPSCVEDPLFLVGTLAQGFKLGDLETDQALEACIRSATACVSRLHSFSARKDFILGFESMIQKHADFGFGGSLNDLHLAICCFCGVSLQKELFQSFGSSKLVKLARKLWLLVSSSTRLSDKIKFLDSFITTSMFGYDTSRMSLCLEFVQESFLLEENPVFHDFLASKIILIHSKCKQTNLMTLFDGSLDFTVLKKGSSLYTKLKKVIFHAELSENPNISTQISLPMTESNIKITMTNFDAVFSLLRPSIHPLTLLKIIQLLESFRSEKLFYAISELLGRLPESPNCYILITNFILAVRSCFDVLRPHAAKIETNPIFTLLCNSLVSSHRECRVQAAKTLACFDSVWDLVFMKIDQMPEKTYLGEAQVLAWTALAQRSEGERLNVLLAKLLALLGARNLLVACATHSALSQACKTRGITCWQLILPFLPSLAVGMAQQIAKKSVLGIALPELLGISGGEILVRTAPYTVPYVLTYYLKDVVKEISRYAKVPKHEILVQEMPRILAVMLTTEEYCENGEFNAPRVLEVLSVCDAHFKNASLSSLIGAQTVRVVWEVCKHYDGSNFDRVVAVVAYVVRLALLKPGNPETKVRLETTRKPGNLEIKVLETYFQTALLGLVQLFSEVVRDTRGKTPTMEKIRSLSAVEFLSKAAKDQMVTALPQVCICLQKGLEDPKLEVSVLKAWTAVVKSLNDKSLSTCFDLIVASVLQKWPELSGGGSLEGVSLLSTLFGRQELVKDKYFNYYFTLSFYEKLDDVCAAANRVLISKRTSSERASYNLLYDIARRVSNESGPVARVGLLDMLRLLASRPDFGPGAEEILSRAYTALVTCATRFKHDNHVTRSCAACIGLLRVSRSRDYALTCSTTSIRLRPALQLPPRDLVAFCARLLDVLCDAFWAAEDPGPQAFLAYGIQELLKLLGIDDLDQLGVKELAKTTLAPLQTSHYELTASGTKNLRSYPIFKPSKDHGDWLRELTLDLVRRSALCAHDSREKSIYTVMETLIKGQNPSISAEILPFVALNSMVKDDDARKSLATEVAYVLQDGLKALRGACISVFRVLDFLAEWMAAQRGRRASRRRRTVFGVPQEVAWKNVEHFLSGVSDLTVAARAADCDAYERAAMYLERRFRQQGHSDDILDRLQKAYEGAGDADSVIGALRTFLLANVALAAAQVRYSSSWRAGLAVFEKLDENEQTALGELNSKLLYCETLQRVTNLPDLDDTVLDCALEAAIMEADAENTKILARKAQGVTGTELNVLLAKALIFKQEQRPQLVGKCVEKSQEIIGQALANSPGLLHSKNLVARLHALQNLVTDDRQSSLLTKDQQNTDFELPWHILTVRAASVEAQERAQLYVQRAQLELDHQRPDLAALLIAKLYALDKSPAAALGFAQILWHQGEREQAVKMAGTLSRAEDAASSAASSSETKKKAQLLHALWMDTLRSAVSQEIVQLYEDAISQDLRWDEPYYHLGLYYGRMLASGEKVLAKVILCYLKAASCSERYLLEVLPKVVTLWMDLKPHSSELKLAEIEIQRAIKTLPKHYWSVVYTQLFSRLPTTSGLTESLVVLVLAMFVQGYPEQGLWTVLAQTASADKKRRHAARRVALKFTEAPCLRLQYGLNNSILHSAEKVFREFASMAQKTPTLRELLLSRDLNFNVRVFPAPLAMPSKTGLKVGKKSLTIAGVDDRVKVMTSLQKPCRMAMFGSDGKCYFILFKRVDDLRKDAKLMEVTNMLDGRLGLNYELRRRQLGVRTFAVVPMSEQSGVIEWVQGHITMKGALDRGYERKELLMNIRKRWELKKHKEREAFFNELVKYYEPVLYRWFLEFFPTPGAWYSARNTFSRTCSVMLMLGHVVGIGDRHGENILISENDGGVLHVDFDCLFEKGKTLKIPERVPFRLTHNMVDAFGVCGVEGTFRILAEVTMLLLRGNEPIMMNILEAFIHDPIMDWRGGRLGTPEDALKKIRAKLRGVELEALPMSVGGQVGYLIKEATDSGLLSQMYFGWLPFW